MKIQITKQEAIEAWKKLHLNLVEISNNATIEIIDNPLGLISQLATPNVQPNTWQKPIGGNYVDLSQSGSSTGAINADYKNYLPQTTSNNLIETSSRLN